MKNKTRGAWLVAVAVAVGVVASSGSLAAQAVGSNPSAPAQVQAIWTADPSPAGVAAAVQRASGSQVAAATAQTWAGCGVGVDPNKVVRTFPHSKVLRCGNANFGYFHIFAQHKSQFEQKAALTGQNWRDVADIGMNASLSDSTVTKFRDANDTTCYSKQIYLVNLQNNQTVDTTIVRTVTGNRSNNVVTAFPSSGYCTGSE